MGEGVELRDRHLDEGENAEKYGKGNPEAQKK